MGDGFSIPIEGDAGPFEEALGRLEAAMRELVATMRAGMAAGESAGAGMERQMGRAAGAVQGVARAQEQVRRGNAGMGSGIGGFLKRAGAAGEAVWGIAAGVQVASGLMKKLAAAKGAKESLAAAKEEAAALKGRLGSVNSSAEAVGKSSGPGRLKAGLVAAAASVGALYVGFRTVRGGARMAGRAGMGAMRLIGSAARTARDAVRGVFAGIRGLGSGLKGLVPRGALPIAGVLSVGAAVAVMGNEFRKSLAAARSFEDVRVGVEQFAGGAEAARKLFDELDAFEAKTPFAGADLQKTLGTVLFSGIRDDAAGLVKELAAVSRTGEDLKNLGDAVGKGFARGRFQTEELNKFVDRGINLMPELERVTGKTGDELRKAVQEGLSFETMRRAIRGLSEEGGQFFGLLERRSRTTGGLLSTMGSALALLRRDFGAPINDALKPILADGISLLSKMREGAARLGKTVGDSLLTVYAAVRSGQGLAVLRAGVKLAFATGVEVLTRGLKSAVAFLATALPSVVDVAFAKLKDPVFWEGVMNVFKGAGKIIQASILEAMPGAERAARAEFERANAETFFGTAGADFARAGDGRDAGKEIAEALLKGGAAAKAQLMAPMGAGLKSALEAWKEAQAGVSREVARMRAENKVPEAPGGAAPARAGDGDLAARAPGSGRGVVSIATSLARVGGGGFGVALMQPLLGESRKQTALLKGIRKAVERPGEPGPARYA